MRINLRRRIEATLSDGRGPQLLWVFCIIAISFFLFWGISRAFFGAEAFSWQEIIALCLDPGVFGGPGKHDGFRLLITLVGIILFAATLISIVSNIFENISDHYRKGEATYNFEHHILILGANKILPGLLRCIEDEPNTKPIVIMTDRAIETLRDEIEASLDDKKFQKRITYYYDKRDRQENLIRANFQKADHIYVLGENNEEFHDLLNLACLDLIQNLDTPPKCTVIMDSQTTMKSFHYHQRSVRNVEIVNLNECKAELFLKQTIHFDDRDSDNEQTPINIVLFGMTALSRAIASTVAYSFHFTKQRHTIITFIDSDINDRVDDYKARNSVLFRHCDEIWGMDVDNQALPENHEIHWRFINSNPSSDKVLSFIEILKKSSIDTYIYVCFDDVRKNLATEISLRTHFGGENLYADFGEYDTALKKTIDIVDTTSKGFDYKSLYKYTFNDRESTYNKEIPFAEKQRVVYMSVVKYFSSRCKIDECNRYIDYLLGLGEDDDGSRYRRSSFCKNLILVDDGMNAVYSGNMEDACEEICSFNNDYIKSLNNGNENNLSDYLAFLLKNYITNVIPVDIDERLMDALFTYAKKYKRLSDESISILGELILKAQTEIIENNCYPSNIPENIAVGARKIIEELANNGNFKACLTLSFLDFDKQQFWFTKAKEIPGKIVPSSFFDSIGENRTESLYIQTSSDECLDWLIHRKTKIDEGNFEIDIISSIEEYANHLTNLSEEALFYRLASVKDLNPSFQGVWLTKALRLSREKKNETILPDVLIKFGDYLSQRGNEKEQAFKYYREAYEMDKQNSEAILKYGRCLEWGQGCDRDSYLAQEIGYFSIHDSWANEMYEDGIFSENFEPDEPEPMSEEDLRLSAEAAKWHEHECDILRQKIEDWERTYPNIEHPYKDLAELWNI